MHNFKTRFTPRLALGLTTLALGASTLVAFAQNTSGASSKPLKGSEWKLVIPAWRSPQGLVRGRLYEPTLRFDADRLRASVGCNAMSATYTRTGESLKIGALISTRMSCGTEVDALENRYSTTLATATKWQLSRDGKILLVQTAKEPLVFTRTTPNPKR